MQLISIYYQECRGIDDCGLCVFVCPKNLIQASDQLNRSGARTPRLRRLEECTGCRNCEVFCPEQVVVLEKPNRGGRVLAAEIGWEVSLSIH